jgi:hypothetical protein
MTDWIISSFEFELRPKLSTKVIRISIQPGQKSAVDFRSITLKADSATCSVPEEEIQILNVFWGATYWDTEFIRLK